MLPYIILALSEADGKDASLSVSDSVLYGSCATCNNDVIDDTPLRFYSLSLSLTELSCYVKAHIILSDDARCFAKHSLTVQKATLPLREI